MKKFEEQANQSLFEKNLITEEQFKQITAHRNLNIFSLYFPKAKPWVIGNIFHHIPTLSYFLIPIFQTIFIAR